MSTKKLVLVADDTFSDFFLLEKAFSMAGLPHVLVHMSSGSKAIQYLRGEAPYENPIQYPFPDLIVVDDKMPSGAGMDVLKFVRERGLKVPVIMLSGSSSPDDAKAALAAGAELHLSKPETLDELVTLAQAMHRRWLAMPWLGDSASHNPEPRAD